MKKVYIGVGHGGRDSGATANGFKEKDLNLTIALACNEVLSRHGVSTKMSRTKDKDCRLEERIRECNAFNPDCAVDIHNNAGGGDGGEVFHSKDNSYDDALAKNILHEIVALGQNSRGLKTKLIPSTGQDYFGFIRSIKVPSVLVECAFIDNKKDLAMVDTPEEQEAMGIAIAKGILKTLGITYREPSHKTERQIVYFRGGKHYTSSNGNTGYEVKAGPAKITKYAEGAKHPYHVIHTDKTSTVYGWVNADTIETTASARTTQVGDIVTFAGGKHYVSADSNLGYIAQGGRAKITNYKPGAKHPYHLIRISGGTSTVYGWVDTDTVNKEEVQ